MMPNGNTRHVKPDYVLAFHTPPYTEIKFVNGHWYLYERTSVVLQDGTRKKKSGPILGTITPEGFVESRKRRRERVGMLQAQADQAAVEAEKRKQIDTTDHQEEKPPASEAKSNPIKHGKLSDSVEVGASTYFYERTLDLRIRLKETFPELWQYIYIVALIRVIYGPHFRRIKLHYQTSILGEIFPSLDLGPASLRNLIVELGKRRDSIRNFMLKDVLHVGSYLLVDGHRLITASQGRDLAEQGYDSKMRYKPQINLLYLFRLTETLGLPAYYKQYAGSTPDVTAFGDLLKDCNLSAEEVIAVTDKGFASEDDFALLVESGLNYVIPLKRNNTFVKGKIPATPADYQYAFRYANRTIFYSEIDVDAENDFKIYLYCDISLYKEEMNTIISKYEKQNQTTEYRIEQEMKRREKKKGKLSDKQLADLKPITLSEVLEDKPSIGTITLRVRDGKLNGQQAFCIWKTRQAIEQFFKTYDDTLLLDDSFMQDDVSEEGRLFLNHLSATMGMNAINEIATQDLSKEISLDDLRATLRTVQADCIDGAWMVKPIKSETAKLASKLSLDIADLSAFDSIVKWKRNPDVQRPATTDNAEDTNEEKGRFKGLGG